jgi:S1-C subfamily serine protease
MTRNTSIRPNRSYLQFLLSWFERLILFLLIAFYAFPSSARAELSIDKNFGGVSGWTIGFSEGIGGCLAATKYKDETTVWLGFTGDKNNAYIAFSNPKWESVEVDGEYELRLIMGRRSWLGKFIGFKRTNEKGIYTAGLKPEFLDDLAESGGVRVFLNRKPLAALSLSGSKDALYAAISCQKKYIEASGGAAPDRDKQKGESSGTGFFVSTDAHLVTNNHVIEGCSNIRVTPVGAKETSAYVVARDKTNDLAILKTSINPTIVPALRAQPHVGESIFVFGFPLSGILSASGNFTTGTITAITGLGDDTRLAQISAPVQPGNSGGPLIDKYGNIVGVIVSKLNALNIATATNDIPQNVNFAIKSAVLMNFLESNGVTAETNTKSRELPPEAIADLAKLFTVRVICN